MKVGALVVGIGDYLYRHDDAPTQLKYAGADAAAIATYLRTCWPQSDTTVLEIDEADATLATFNVALRTLERSGPFNLLFIFLSGHGVLQPDLAGFLVQPESGSDHFSVLRAEQLDQTLADCSAQRTVLVLDCCYAAGIVRQIPFFNELGNDEARLFIASSRADQLTWEADQVGHGVFTAHFLDLLRTGEAPELDTVRDAVEVDGELFRVLCEQVPLYVMKHKGYRQEPVKGGTSSVSLFLPTLRAKGKLEHRTPLSIAFHGLRQIIIRAGVIVLALLAFSYSAIFYLEPDSKGNIVAHRGTRWLEPVFRFLPTERVDTGIDVSELSDNPAAARNLRSGFAGGVWMHRSGGGYRSWIDTTFAGLEPVAASRYATLLGASDHFLPEIPTSDRVLTVDLLQAAWSALDPSSNYDLNAILARIPGHGREDPVDSPFDPNKLDFGVLDLTTEQLVRYAQVLEYAAIIDPQATWPIMLRFAKVSREWLYHSTDLQRGRGAKDRVRKAVAESFARLFNVRVDQGLNAVDDEMAAVLDVLIDIGYADPLATSLVRLHDHPLSRKAAKLSLEIFKGDLHSPKQELALANIWHSLDGSEGSAEAVDIVVRRFEDAGDVTNVYLTRTLIEAGATRSLSEKMLSQISKQIRDALARAEPSFMDSETARVAAYAIGQLSEAARDDAYRLIELTSEDLPPLASALAEIYSALAKQGLDRPGMLTKVSTQASLAKPYVAPIETTSESQPGMTIVFSRDSWVAALAVFGTNRLLPESALAILRDHQENPALRVLISKALVFQEELAVTEFDLEALEDEIVATRRDARRRSRISSIAIYRLAALSLKSFTDELAQLRERRKQQIEPEVRIALGQIMIGARLARTTTETNSVPAFE